MSAVQRAKNVASAALRHAWRMIILVVGGTVVAIGVAMIVLPGPAFVVIPIGLGILATEFAWARHLLHAAKERARNLVNSRANGRRATRAGDGPNPAGPPIDAATGLQPAGAAMVLRPGPDAPAPLVQPPGGPRPL